MACLLTPVVIQVSHARLIPQFIHAFVHDMLLEAKDVVTQLARSHGFAARDRSSLHFAILLQFFRCSEIV